MSGETEREWGIRCRKEMWQEEARRIVPKLPDDVKHALLGEDAAPIPDSLWFGKWSHLREHVGACHWRWSPLGVAVQETLRSIK